MPRITVPRPTASSHVGPARLLLAAAFTVGSLGACDRTPRAAPQGTPSPDALITDTLHQLGEAASLSTSGREREAVAAWTLSYDLFKRHLLPSVRAKDPGHALEIEVRYGRVRAGLREGAQVEEDALWIDAALDDARPWLEPAVGQTATDPAVPLR